MRGQNAPKTGRRRTRNDFAYIHFSARFPLPRRRREIIIYRKSESTEAGSSIRFCAFFLLQAFGFSGLRVTGLMAQSVRLSASCSRFFFFESFSYGINFSMVGNLLLFESANVLYPLKRCLVKAADHAFKSDNLVTTNTVRAVWLSRG